MGEVVDVVVVGEKEGQTRNGNGRQRKLSRWSQDVKGPRQRGNAAGKPDDRDIENDEADDEFSCID